MHLHISFLFLFPSTLVMKDWIEFDFINSFIIFKITTLRNINKIREMTWNEIIFFYWTHVLVSNMLAFFLLRYGFDKLFKHQFYLPEPNTLYTPVGLLSKDILFWTSMGTSHSYNVFMGLIEIIPAFLLFFKRTRMLGGLISFAVLLNVLMINIGFDITVKILSSFLL